MQTNVLHNSNMWVKSYGDKGDFNVKLGTVPYVGNIYTKKKFNKIPLAKDNMKKAIWEKRLWNLTTYNCYDFHYLEVFFLCGRLSNFCYTISFYIWNFAFVWKLHHIPPHSKILLRSFIYTSWNELRNSTYVFNLICYNNMNGNMRFVYSLLWKKNISYSTSKCN